MTAQSTTQRTASGVRIAPMIVVLIAIIAFASGLAFAEVTVPALTTSVSPVAAAPVGATITTDRRAYDGIPGSASTQDALSSGAGRNR